MHQAYYPREPNPGKITRQLRENAMHDEAEPPAADENLEELLEQMTPENRHALALEGAATGNEAW
jgi:antitoxin component of MazEF toxin-antitoxin module